MPKTFFNNINLNFLYPGWRQCQVSKVLESNSVIIVLWGCCWRNWVHWNWPQLQPPLVSIDLTWARLEANPLWMEADISTQSAQASIEKNTVPCIPAGPKSCLVRKMAWSWYSAWSGSRRCCVLAHRHTCSRLRDGLPRSIRLIDCRDARTMRIFYHSNCEQKCNCSPYQFPVKATVLVKAKEKDLSLFYLHFRYASWLEITFRLISLEKSQRRNYAQPKIIFMLYQLSDTYERWIHMWDLI